MKMYNTMINVLDLPNEILFSILKKLTNFDVLYSLVGVNERLHSIACDSSFTRSIDLTISSWNEEDNSRKRTLLSRFCLLVLPQIHCNVECLCIEGHWLDRVLHSGRFPNLCKLTLLNLELTMAYYAFHEKSPFIRDFKHQISDLSITIIDKLSNQLMHNALTDIYHNIFFLFKNLKYLDFDVDDTYSFQRSLLSDLPSTICLSSSIVHLRIRMHNFDDCICLLDGRLSQLNTLIINLDFIYDTSNNLMNNHELEIKQDASKSIENSITLHKLKCFSIHVSRRTAVFQSQIIPLLNRMINLEELTLSLRIQELNLSIDANYLRNFIINKMNHLHKFMFDIVTKGMMIFEYSRPTADDIRRIFIEKEQCVDCYIDYSWDNLDRCHIYSLPFNMERIHPITHSFPGGLFMNVRTLNIFDYVYCFEHDFFAKISRSFPLLNRLLIRNTIEQNRKLSNELIRQQETMSSTIEYTSLTELDCTDAHIDYVEQFLCSTNTRLHGLRTLHVQYEHLVNVTKNFTRDTTRINCAKLKQINFTHKIKISRSKNFRLYFPSL